MKCYLEEEDLDLEDAQAESASEGEAAVGSECITGEAERRQGSFSE